MDYKIKDLPESERPRERLESKGPHSLSDAELLALIIRSGTENQNAVEVSKQILTEYNFNDLVNASINELKIFKGIGNVKAGQIQALFELFRRFSEDKEEKSDKIKNYQDALDYFRPVLAHKEEECLAMICLDSNNRVLTKNLENNIIAQGSINKINIEFRKIVKKALKENAAGVILAHNHPGGNPEPSDEDVNLTKEIAGTLRDVDITILDHIVLGKEKSQSLREIGKLPIK